MSYSSTILADSPIRYYRLGQSGGTVATDLGSQAQNSTISATGITYNQTGLLAGDADTSMFFDGASGTVTFPTTGLPTGAGAWSVEAWVRLPAIPPPTTQFPAILEMGTATTNEKVVLYYFGSKFSVSGQAGTNQLDSALIASPAGRVFHVVATYDGTTQKLYLNGVFAGSNVVTYNLIAGGSNDIGGHSSTTFWSGWLDEVAMYSAALSATQIATHYTAGLTNTNPYPRYTPRTLGATIIPASVSQPLPYIGRALGSTIVYESRTFVPRALGGIYIPDDPTLLWVPRAIASTTQIPSGVTLSSTLAGVGTLSETFTLATSLTDTIPGVGTLSATLSVNLTLAVEFDGVGTLSGTITETTALTTTLAGVGTLSGTLSANAALSTTCAGVGTLTPTLSANLALPSITLAGAGTLAGSLFAVSQPLPYIGRGLFSTIIYENRTFIPRALSGVYIPDTILPVPRALLSTIQATVGLGRTMAGVGTLSETFTLATALSTTLAGVGTLSATLSTTGGVSLTCTMAGVGTLSETLSLATSLADTIPGVGTLSGTLSANLTLASVTTAGVGTLAATMTAQAILSTSLVGAGTLSGVYSLRVALSLTFAGAGTLAGAITIPVTVFLSATCVTRDMQAIATTRDMQAIALTRDEKMGALTRDENATVTTRDMQATAKTRS